MLLDETMQRIACRLAWLERAASLEGRPRERLIALSEAEELISRLYPEHDRALQVVRVASQLGRSRPEQEDPVRQVDNRLTDLLMNVIRDAVQVGDLPLRSKTSPQELAFVIWALAFGTRALMGTRTAAQSLRIEDGFQVGRRALDLLLDSLSWKPLSPDFDYESTRRQVRETILPPPPDDASQPHAGRLMWHRSRIL